MPHLVYKHVCKKWGSSYAIHMQADFIEKVKGFSYSVLCPSSPSGLMWTSMLALGLFIWEMGGHRLGGAWVPNLPLKEDV